MLWTLITVVKIVSTLATAYFGLDAVFGSNTNPDGSLNKHGRRARLGIVVSAILAVATVALETFNERQRETEQERQRIESSARLDSILTRAQTLSDSLRVLKLISLGTFAQETRNLRQTSTALRTLRAN